MPDKKNDNTDKDFPGYPHYPANEDIMNQKDVEKIDVDVENLSRANNQTSSALPDKSVKVPQADGPRPAVGDMDDDIRDDEDVKAKVEDDADITAEDLTLLGEQDADFGEREELTGEDLDVPGSEDDDADEDIGEEDEENNYYSLGGDAHENLDEDKGD